MDLQFSSKEVRDIASNIRTQAATVQSVFEDSNNAMNEMNTESTLQSAAGEQAKASFDALKVKFEGFYNTLINYAVFLEQTATSYEELEAQTKNAADTTM